MNEFLPEPLPDSPLKIFATWFAEARERAVQPNPDSMVLASVDSEGKPSARVVLCKQLYPEGYAVFFTNYESRKGRELLGAQRAAAVIHWDTLHRQVRLEGPIVRSPAAESDEYFASRGLTNRIGAWASRQSEPLASRSALAHQVDEVMKRFGVPATAQDAQVPRPPNWGGFRLWFDTVELWVEGPGRIHDRAIWKRTLQQRDEFNFVGSDWLRTRLNP
jgi:pyridoxamine 5'-phosphate oxidase